jgi:hypothetical protein
MPSPPRLLTALALSLLPGLSGCQDNERETLRQVGNRSMAHLQDLVGGPRGKLAGVLQGVRGTLAARNGDDRVAARLRFDKEMVGAEVTVKLVKPGVVELSGTVRSGEQKVQAVTLAGSTVGIEQVVDQLTIATGSP